MNRKLVGSMAILLAVVEAPAYILLHHWGWLNQDQHSAAVQATTGVLLGIPTLIFAVFAFVATYESAEASQAQAKAAQAQTAVSELQLEISKATLKEQTRPILNLKRLAPERPSSGPLRAVGYGSEHDGVSDCDGSVVSHSHSRRWLYPSTMLL
jgi:hypothetical protein